MNNDIPISGHTSVAALIGNPVGHSLSPALHNASFARTGTDAVFVAFDVEKDDLQNVVEAFKALRLCGYSVTMPLKQAICPYLDELTPAAALMGAVNTVQIKDGKSIGHNTDGAGFVANCRSHGFDPTGRTITLVGTGGAGSAVYTQLALEGAKRIFVFNRKDEFLVRQNAQEVSEKTGVPIEVHALDDRGRLASCVAQSDLFVNATRVGMPPLDNECVIDESMLHDRLIVADTVYEPRTTKLIALAQRRGLVTVPGVGMLLHQAALSEKIWLDVDMPIEEIERRFFS